MTAAEMNTVGRSQQVRQQRRQQHHTDQRDGERQQDRGQQ
jgi:hypothetical protein